MVNLLKPWFFDLDLFPFRITCQERDSIFSPLTHLPKVREEEKKAMSLHCSLLCNQQHAGKCRCPVEKLLRSPQGRYHCRVLKSAMSITGSLKAPCCSALPHLHVPVSLACKTMIQHPLFWRKLFIGLWRAAHALALLGSFSPTPN